MYGVQLRILPLVSIVFTHIPFVPPAGSDAGRPLSDRVVAFVVFWFSVDVLLY